MPLCEHPSCYDAGDLYDCWAAPGAVAPVRHYFCPPHMQYLLAVGRFAHASAVLCSPQQSLLTGSLVSLRPSVAPGTLCSVLGCVGEAIFAGEGLLHVGNRLFLEFQGALCQLHYEEDYVQEPKYWYRSLTRSRR